MALAKTLEIPVPVSQEDEAVQFIGVRLKGLLASAGIEIVSKSLVWREGRQSGDWRLESLDHFTIVLADGSSAVLRRNGEMRPGQWKPSSGDDEFSEEESVLATFHSFILGEAEEGTSGSSVKPSPAPRPSTYLGQGQVT